MMQQINLYQPIFRKEKRIFSSIAMLWSLCIALLGLMLIYGVGLWHTRGLEKERLHMQASITSSEQKVKLLEAQYPVREESKRLQAREKTLQRELRAKQLIATRLGNRSFGNRTGFSAHLAGLARQRVRNLWLTGFSLLQGGTVVELRGETTAADDVPRYLKRLSAESVFSGTHFRRLEMERPEERDWLIRFNVTSREDKDNT